MPLKIDVTVRLSSVERSTSETQRSEKIVRSSEVSAIWSLNMGTVHLLGANSYSPIGYFMYLKNCHFRHDYVSMELCFTLYMHNRFIVKIQDRKIKAKTIVELRSVFA